MNRLRFISTCCALLAPMAFLPGASAHGGEATPKPTAVAAFANPRVSPGRVAWHSTLAEACAAARKSGKPVLLFQMMGRLDEQFC